MSNTEQPTMNIEVVQNHLVSNWKSIGGVTIRDGCKLNMPGGIPALPGVYRIIATKTGEAYIGEGKNLSKRLQNHENAGYYDPKKKAATNRYVQGWIYRQLTENNTAVQISICTEANIVSESDSVVTLDFQQKYFRIFVESLTIFNHKDLILANKQFHKS
jgi:hypothetical protein